MRDERRGRKVVVIGVAPGLPDAKAFQETAVMAIGLALRGEALQPVKRVLNAHRGLTAKGRWTAVGRAVAPRASAASPRPRCRNSM